MILNELQELSKKGQLDVEHLGQYKVSDILEEELTLFNGSTQLDYNTYSGAIVITANFAAQKDEEVLISNNPFFEKFLLQQIYMQAKGIPALYMQALIILNGIAESFVVVHHFLMKQDCCNEYDLLVHEYERYINASLSMLQLQSRMLEEMASIDMKELFNKMDNFKELITPEE